MVRRVYVEKKEGMNGKAKELLHELRHYLGIGSVKDVRILNRYDVENLSESELDKACRGILAEPATDVWTKDAFACRPEDFVFSVEFLPGQFDQRSDSAMQCIRLAQRGDANDPVIRTAVTYVIEGKLTEEEKESIRRLCINPVDQQLAEETIPEHIEIEYEKAADVPVLTGFCTMDETDFSHLYSQLSLAMTPVDLRHIRAYFRGLHRDPTETEIRVLDTYWSDHCRHTTFSTVIRDVRFGGGEISEQIKRTYEEYMADRKSVYGQEEGDRPVCLMDMALMAMKKLRSRGLLKEMEQSEEINACSIVIPVDEDGRITPWLLNFKNETHNHPTEIEPFGGAATCLGGAIRDPLSGRTYVYQAMRITGAADPRQPVSSTLPGKLPQKKLVREAARGYSSYGNQIGLATGYVKELYHPSYVAKHMELGAVLGAARQADVIRKRPIPGDVIVLLGGRTGRDGMGGATGSSKIHTEHSIDLCGAEVQKGNPPTERKIQRLFRDPSVSLLIKRCNDFGAGGVSVAIGELARGVDIDLDRVPKKYEGLSGTEIAISESQERMAVVLSAENVDSFLQAADRENLEATVVAKVTSEPRLVMRWRGRVIVDLERKFLDTNGARQTTDVEVIEPDHEKIPGRMAYTCMSKETMTAKQRMKNVLSSLNVCSQKGLVERFDPSIGAGAVLLPCGGLNQESEIQTMVAKLPVQDAQTSTVSLMSYGFDPDLCDWSPYHGAAMAVTESVAKIVAAGGDYRRIYFTFQEYFQRMTEDSKRWSQPFCALLGAYRAQMGFGLAAIGGKDSMSGTFGAIDVPPTFVSFAVSYGKQENIVTPEMKPCPSAVLLLKGRTDRYGMPDFSYLCRLYDAVRQMAQRGKLLAAYAVEKGGAAASLAKMCFGNMTGFCFSKEALDRFDGLFVPDYGSLLIQIPQDIAGEVNETIAGLGLDAPLPVGEVRDDRMWQIGSERILLSDLWTWWKEPLEEVYPRLAKGQTEDIIYAPFDGGAVKPASARKWSAPAVHGSLSGRPRVFIPVMPGTNCEYDSEAAFKRAGAIVSTAIFRNLSAAMIEESTDVFVQAIRQSQIIMLPGGFSAGDEPDGSAKYFGAVFRNKRIREEIERLLTSRDGLMLGICNGFQTLIKLGLLPEGSIRPMEENSPTLTENTIGRHIAKMAYIKVVENKSPWLSGTKKDNVYVNPASHGEGRFMADTSWIRRLKDNGQIATVYCDPCGRVNDDSRWNINGSVCSVEGITSPDGRIYGKMAHAERIGNGLAQNIWGEQDMHLFASGVAYFKDL